MSQRYAIFVDLPNLYSSLLRYFAPHERIARDYFLEWFNFGELCSSLEPGLGNIIPTWVFYSGRRFGPRDNRIQDKYLDRFIDQTNQTEGVTAYDVNIPGHQRELATYECSECGHAGIAEWESEKGIDSSLTVHLFDTMDSWDVAYLCSGDADFVPAVRSLRRRGKVVNVAAFHEPSPALVREAFSYVDLSKTFIKIDLFAYQCLREQGSLEAWLTEAKDVDMVSEIGREIRIGVSISNPGGGIKIELTVDNKYNESEAHVLDLGDQILQTYDMFETVPNDNIYRDSSLPMGNQDSSVHQFLRLEVILPQYRLFPIHRMIRELSSRLENCASEVDKILGVSVMSKTISFKNKFRFDEKLRKYVLLQDDNNQSDK